MKNQIVAMSALLFLVCGLCLVGCDAPVSSGAQQDGFAAGAFPPTLSDMDYHADAWTRADCLTCHEKGVNDAPQVRHTSLPAAAKDSKCRSCHVLIPGQKPPS